VIRSHRKGISPDRPHHSEPVHRCAILSLCHVERSATNKPGASVAQERGVETSRRFVFRHAAAGNSLLCLIPLICGSLGPHERGTARSRRKDAQYTFLKRTPYSCMVGETASGCFDSAPTSTVVAKFCRGAPLNMTQGGGKAPPRTLRRRTPFSKPC
jgi:hypothetical protein